MGRPHNLQRQADHKKGQELCKHCYSWLANKPWRAEHVHLFVYPQAEHRSLPKDFHSTKNIPVSDANKFGISIRRIGSLRSQSWKILRVTYRVLCPVLQLDLGVGVRTGSPLTAHAHFEGKCFRSSLRKPIKIVACHYHYSSVDFQVASKASSNHQSHRLDKKSEAGRRKKAHLKRLKEPQKVVPKAVQGCNYPSRWLLFLNFLNNTMSNDWSISYSWSFCRSLMFSSCVLCAQFGDPACDTAFAGC